jgi:hypothetical protein
MKRKVLIVSLALLLVFAFSVVPAVACNEHNRLINDYHRHKQDNRTHLVYFYNATSGHLIKNGTKTNETRMLNVVKQLDRDYNITYYDLGANPGYTQMARFAYGVTQTPTLSVLGPNFPAQASDFHNIVGYHNYFDTLYLIKTSKV